MHFNAKQILFSVVSSVALLSSVASADDLRIQGFLSVGVTMNDSDNPAVDDELNFKDRNVLGIQLSRQINDLVSVTGQLVARGSDDYDVDATWAYATISPTDNDSIRVGRLRVPFFYYSDFLEVGYAYNWVSPPSDVYRIGFSSIDAVDYTRSFDAGDVSGSVQVYYGRWEGDLNVGEPVIISGNDIANTPPSAPTPVTIVTADNKRTDFDLTGFTGIVLNLSWESLAFRASYHQADLSTSTPFVPFDEDTSTFGEVAVVYDDGDNFAIVEYTDLQHDNLLLVDDAAYLVSYARRLGDFTLHGTYTFNNESVENVAVQGGEQEVTGFTVGARWDVVESTAFKFEAQNRSSETEGVAGSVDNTLFTIGMDMIF
ncbi:MAG: hypothetical protein HRU20_12315 [Pseudomonadales bacterium]|nr:hypothetical protein [Pseudomonadales bacterium]